MAYILKKKQELGGSSGFGGPSAPIAAPTPARAPGPSASAVSAPTQAPGFGPAPGAPNATSGTGWVNLQDYLGVNNAAGQGLAGGLADGVGQAFGAGQKDVDSLETEHKAGLQDDVSRGQDIHFGSMASMPRFGEVSSAAEKVGQRAKGLVNFSQRGTAIADQNAGANYSPGMGRWDSYLAGGAGGDVLKQAADQYGGLSDYLSQKNVASGDLAVQKQGEVTQGRAERASAARAEAGAASAEAARQAEIQRYADMSYDDFTGGVLDPGAMFDPGAKAKIDPGYYMHLDKRIWDQMNPQERKQAYEYGMWWDPESKKSAESYSRQMTKKYG